MQLLAILKEQVTSPDAASLRRVPQAERKARLNKLKTRLNGILIEGNTEPGHSFLDAVCNMHETNQLKYFPPEKCVSRLHELTNQKTPGKTIEVESSKLVLKDKAEEYEVSATTSLQILEAFKRRGLALDFAGCMTFQNHDKYIQTLYSHLHREPPAGFSRRTVSQLVAADKAAWSRVIEDNVKPRRDAVGALPLDTALIEALKSYECSFLLIPLPTKQPKPPKTQKQTGGYGAAHTDDPERQAKEKVLIVSSLGPKAKGEENRSGSPASPKRSGTPVATELCQAASPFVSISISAHARQEVLHRNVIVASVCVQSALASMKDHDTHS